MKKLYIMSLMFLVVIGGVSALTNTNISPFANDLTIQEMIDQTAPGGTVNLENKVYIGDGNTNIDISKSITINGNGATIDAQKNSRIFNINQNTAVTINNVKLLNGNAVASRYGGAILNDGSLTLDTVSIEDSEALNAEYGAGGAISNNKELTIKNSKFINNKASYYGGAIYNSPEHSVLSVVDSEFNGNIVNSSTVNEGNDHKSGGAIFNSENATLSLVSSNFTANFAEQGGAVGNHGDGNVDSSQFLNNSVYEYVPDYGGYYCGAGGAIVNINVLNVSNSKFIGNHGDVDGAISNAGDLCVLSVFKSEFDSNFVNSNTGASAGAIDSTGFANILESTFTNNHADGDNSDSGAICNNNKMSISKSTFNGNTASNGGAIRNQHFKDVSELNVSGSVFNANVATNDGGAIYSTALLNVDNSNFSSNRADDGGAVYNNGLLSVESSSFDTNTANGGTLESGGGAIYDGGSAAITNSKFTRNNILRGTDDGYSWGGAAITVIKHGSVNITNSNFANNSMSAISIHNDANTNIKSSTFVDNNGRGGGALKLITFAHADVIDCTFRNNVAEDYGGAISNNGVINIVNSNFSNNRVTNSVYGGGAIANWNWLGNCTVSGSVFENNRAALGGAVYNDKNTPLVNKNNTFKPPVSKGVNDIYQVT